MIRPQKFETIKHSNLDSFFTNDMKRERDFKKWLFLSLPVTIFFYFFQRSIFNEILKSSQE